MKILYRITDGGNNKSKLDFVYDKKRMFLHFISIFTPLNEVIVFADNVNDDLYLFMAANYDPNKIIRTSLGNSKSFMFTLDFAIKQFTENDIIYFAEDDYVYKLGADKIIEEGLTIADYSCGYDHPDKYINYSEGGPNPFIENGGELTRVLITNNSHWKITNSFCMTFASTVKILKQDYNIFMNNCCFNNPNDFNIFCHLNRGCGRKLVSCIPAVCTHGETEWLAKFVDWKKEFNSSFH